MIDGRSKGGKAFLSVEVALASLVAAESVIVNEMCQRDLTVLIAPVVDGGCCINVARAATTTCKRDATILESRAFNLVVEVGIVNVFEWSSACDKIHKARNAQAAP